MNDPLNHTDLQYLKEFLLQQIEANKQISIAWRAAHDKTHEQEHSAREKAEIAMDVRLHSMNQLKAQIDSERGLYLSKEQYDEKHEALGQRVTMVEERVLQRMQLNWDSIERRLNVIEHAQTTFHAQSEYAKSQQQSAFVKWGIIIAICNLGMAVLINFVLKSP